ncbi:hypothetical protein V501_06044 [Pseudogymnoascus sp. VKM F-4519 (FW-2642)]|nr:hypothetical protein V501_06044 [Pseudogymnoascus sp. VKM F-4519 (FW-2642)]
MSHYGGTPSRAPRARAQPPPHPQSGSSPPTHTTTAELYRAASTIAPGSSLSAPRRNTDPPRQQHAQLASCTPPSVRACARGGDTCVYSLFGATLIVD